VYLTAGRILERAPKGKPPVVEKVVDPRPRVVMVVILQ
jgi:hypothetical protein